MVQWLANGQRGLSSNQMFKHLTGIETERDERRREEVHFPYDPDDLRRCRLLLERCPELMPALPRMASCSPEWEALVVHWDDLCLTMDREAPNWRNAEGRAAETYKMMKDLLEEANPSRYAHRMSM